MQSIAFYRDEFNDYLEKKIVSKEPNGLYGPMRYILGLGGKRLRPVLALISAELFGGAYKKALDAAVAVEVFHNFSLVHDDIMDDAPLRRGRTTVHEKWGLNAGILSGDVMLINSYQYFESYTGAMFKDLVQLFSTTAVEVCEGQQYDIDFGARDDVTEAEYLKMIAYKTAVLVASALKMGAIVAQTTPRNQELIYTFGRHLGIVFQLQDDYLDAFGDPEIFGKQVGGDIIENKKTFLYLKSLEQGSNGHQRQLTDLFSIQPKDPASKIAAIKTIFVESGAVDATRSAIQKYANKAFDALEEIDVPKERKKILRTFGESLMQRTV